MDTLALPILEPRKLRLSELRQHAQGPPGQVSGRPRLGARCRAELLHSPTCPGCPGVRGDLRGDGPTSWAASGLPSQAGTFGLRSLSSQLLGWLACGLSSPKRNPGSWSDFLGDVALLKAELRPKPHLHAVQTAGPVSFGAPWGRFPSQSVSQRSHRLYKTPLTEGSRCQSNCTASCSRGCLLPAILRFHQVGSFIQQLNRHAWMIWLLTEKQPLSLGWSLFKRKNSNKQTTSVQ